MFIKLCGDLTCLKFFQFLFCQQKPRGRRRTKILLRIRIRSSSEIYVCRFIACLPPKKMRSPLPNIPVVPAYHMHRPAWRASPGVKPGAEGRHPGTAAALGCNPCCHSIPIELWKNSKEFIEQIRTRNRPDLFTLSMGDPGRFERNPELCTIIYLGAHKYISHKITNNHHIIHHFFRSRSPSMSKTRTRSLFVSPLA